MSAPLLTGRHVMLDLETLGTGKQAAWLQVGMAEFWPEERRVSAWASWYVDVKSSFAAGRQVDPGALLFWLDDEKGAGPEARSRLVAGLRDAPSLVDVLRQVDDSFQTSNGRQGMGARREPPDGVWSHGAAFDLAMAEDTFQSLGRWTPFKYSSIRDTRTVFQLAGMDFHAWVEDDFGGWSWPEGAPPYVLHDAQSDAIAQAMGVMAACDMLAQRAGRPPQEGDAA